MATSSIFHHIVIDNDEKAQQLLDALISAEGDYQKREKEGKNKPAIKWATDDDIRKMLSKKYEF